MSDHVTTNIVDRIAMLDPEIMAGVIDEALRREGELMTRIGRRRLIEALLKGQVTVQKIGCPDCHGKGKRTVTVARSTTRSSPATTADALARSSACSSRTTSST